MNQPQGITLILLLIPKPLLH